MNAIEGGLSHRKAAARFCVAISTAGNWHRLWRKTGSARPGKQGHPVRSKLDAFEAETLAMIEESKDIALYEITERLAAEPHPRRSGTSSASGDHVLSAHKVDGVVTPASSSSA